MVFTTAKPFPVEMTPFANIAGVSYRDGTTFMREIALIKEWLNESLVPEFNQGIGNAILEFQEGIQNAELEVTNAKGGWQEAFDEFIADITVQLAALNDAAVAGLLGDAGSLAGAKIRQLFGYEFNVKHYGAIGDGTTNDVPAIRSALTAAGAAAVLLKTRTTIILPPGEYWCPPSEELTWVFPGDGQFSKRFFDVPGNVRLKGEGGVIKYNCSYDDRAMIFYTNGSSVHYKDLVFKDVYDMAGGSRPTGIPIGGGDAYDATWEGELRNVVIDGCEFDRPWYPTKFGMTKTAGTGTARDIHIKNCRSQGEPLSTSSGGYNFTSKGPGRIKEVSVTNSRCYDVTVSAAVGMYGVHDFVVSGNLLRGSNINGGGVQTENGAFNGTITDNTLIDHFNHVWLDDSNDITVSGNRMRNTTPDDSSKGVRMTYQGFDNDISHKAGDFQISGNSMKNCYICTEAFSNPQAGGTPTMGDVNIVGNLISLDGVVINIGIRTGAADSVSIAGNLVKGAKTQSIRLSPSVGQLVSVTGNTTKKVGAETSVGLDILNLNASHPMVANNRFENGEQAGLTYVSARIGDTKITKVNTSPVTTPISGNPGDIALNKGATSSADVLFVKSGTGLVGWSAK